MSTSNERQLLLDDEGAVGGGDRNTARSRYGGRPAPLQSVEATGRPPSRKSGAGNKPRSQWQSVDLYQSLESVTRHPSLAHEGYYNKRGHCLYLVWRMLETIVVLVLTGVLTGLITLAANLLIAHFSPIPLMIVSELSHDKLLACIVFTVYTVSLSLIAVVVVNNVCPEAVGGGVPEVKTVLSGLVWRPILTVRLIWAKMIGLVFAFTAGLSVGKEGPFVHVAVAVAESLMRLKCFRHCRQNISKRLDILGYVGVTMYMHVGQAATFGTPFGGVLFSIEATATYYMVRNLPRAFLTAVCASIVYNLAGLKDTFNLFSDTQMDSRSTYIHLDLLVCIVLGVVSGIAGSIFVGIISGFARMRNRFLSFSVGRDALARRRFIVVLFTTMFVAPVIFLDMEYGLKTGDKRLTDYMFEAAPIGLTPPLLCYLPIKFIITALCVSLPLPVGLFSPVFVTGGALGRIYGELLSIWSSRSSMQFTTLQPAEMALIGAASFSSGVTRAISTAVIVFELTSSPTMHMRLPMSLAILVAYFVGNRFTKNVYDVILDTNGVPTLPELPVELYMVSASQVMTPIEECPYLVLGATFSEAEELEKNTTEPLIPVVDSHEHMALVGAVLLEDLRDSVKKMQSYVAEVSGMSEPSKEKGNGHQGKRVTFTPRSSAGGKGGGPVLSISKSASFSDGERDSESRAEEVEPGDGGQAQEPMDGPTRPKEVSRSRPSMLSMKDLPVNFVVLKDSQRAVSLTPTRTALPFTFAEADVLMDPSPYQIADGMLLNKVDFSFRMLKLSQAFVVKSGRLVGVVTREGLTSYVGGREKKPMHRCFQLLSACLDACCCRKRSLVSPFKEDELTLAPDVV